MKGIAVRIALALALFYVVCFTAYTNLIIKFFGLPFPGMVAVVLIPLTTAGFIYLNRMQKKVSLKSSEKFSISALFFASLYGVFAYDVYQQNPASLPIMAAALFATFGWLYTAYENRNNNRKAHTLNILLQMRNSAEYNKHREIILKHFSPQTKIDTSLIAQTQKSVTDPAINLRWSVVYLANYIEFICVGYVTRDLDEGLLIKSFRSIIINFWDSFEPFLLEERQDDYGRYNPKIYENIEITAQEMRRKRIKEGLNLGPLQANRIHGP
ncbi:DUF4760 domain-containing protein [Rhizobium sp. CCGE 510]|uniref:DUF4760 domain-containing protein n=1 Tax=Rhizobium sp. CCGE 510 TaxID=1132836 RepID=UPI0012F6636D|nr:DUF4760 domain-containing protein [Rhizobium sp. CCGE 510]